MKIKRIIICHLIFFSSLLSFLSLTNGDESEDPLKVFIFAGQSNMVGSDSNVKDIQRFPPFIGLESAQENIRFAYSIGREKKFESDGWQSLSPVNNVGGPELSFARMVSAKLKSEIAIIKCAAGGTHLWVILPTLAIAQFDGVILYLSAYTLSTIVSMILFTTAIGHLNKYLTNWHPKLGHHFGLTCCIITVSIGCYWLITG